MDALFVRLIPGLRATVLLVHQVENVAFNYCYMMNYAILCTCAVE